MATSHLSTGEVGERSDFSGLHEGARAGFPGIVSGVKARTTYWLATMGFDLAILIAMAIALIGSVLGLGGHVRLCQTSVLLPMICMASAMAMRAWQSPAKWREDISHILRDWVPFLLIVFIYENLHDVAGQVTDFDFARTLMGWDVAIFGVEPTIWAQKFFSPILTDLLSVSYGMYFALPLFIMFLLSLWGRRFDFRHMALTLTLVFIMGFVGYVFLPASPPRYFIEQMYTTPARLHGLFLFDRLQGAWDGLSVISGGAFPSLHVGISTVALIYAFRFRHLNRMCKAVWYACIPLVTCLWFSTVYLRHHWVIDIAAGWAVALLAYAFAVPMMRAWAELRRRHGLIF
ncbi:MAG: phosphatase PAP2 family protein [Pseudomonadota bacterium]